jgi:hypothetical protein
VFFPDLNSHVFLQSATKLDLPFSPLQLRWLQDIQIQMMKTSRLTLILGLGTQPTTRWGVSGETLPTPLRLPLQALLLRSQSKLQSTPSGAFPDISDKCQSVLTHESLD